MKATRAAAAVTHLVAGQDYANANRFLRWFSDDLSLAGPSYDYIASMTDDEPEYTGYIQFDAAIAAFSEIHRDLVGLPITEWIFHPERYIELTTLELEDSCTHAADHAGLVHPTLLQHGVIIPGASLSSWSDLVERA